MKFLIVNADDFGFSAGVNRAIIEAHQQGIVTSTTIMANMPAFTEAVLMAKANPALGVGLHFNITQGQPVAARERVRSLLNDEGEFTGSSGALLKRSLLGQLKSDELRIELRAQIEKAQSTGLALTHIDSHKHSHAIPQIYSVLAETLPDYGIKAIRLMNEFSNLRVAPQWLSVQAGVAFALTKLCQWNRRFYPASELFVADNFYGIAQTGLWTKDWLMYMLRQLPDGVSELMTHPGYDELQLGKMTTRLTASREVELKLLLDEDVKTLIQQAGIQLRSY